MQKIKPKPNHLSWLCYLFGNACYLHSPHESSEKNLLWIFYESDILNMNNSYSMRFCVGYWMFRLVDKLIRTGSFKFQSCQYMYLYHYKTLVFFRNRRKKYYVDTNKEQWNIIKFRKKTHRESYQVDVGVNDNVKRGFQ